MLLGQEPVSAQSVWQSSATCAIMTQELPGHEGLNPDSAGRCQGLPACEQWSCDLPSVQGLWGCAHSAAPTSTTHLLQQGCKG